jgi:hypothetical protein
LAVYTNAPGYARTLLELADGLTPGEDPEPEVRRLSIALLGPTAVHTAPMSDASWDHIIVTGYAPESQYDQLIRLARAGPALPDGVACVARMGDRFHGFRGRTWAGRAGRVAGIGDGLELHLAGRAEPITRGRLILDAPGHALYQRAS